MTLWHKWRDYVALTCLIFLLIVVMRIEIIQLQLFIEINAGVLCAAEMQHNVRNETFSTLQLF